MKKKKISSKLGFKKSVISNLESTKITGGSPESFFCVASVGGGGGTGCITADICTYTEGTGSVCKCK